MGRWAGDGGTRRSVLDPNAADRAGQERAGQVLATVRQSPFPTSRALRLASFVSRADASELFAIRHHDYCAG